MKILVINPGSTSTKIAVYDNENQLMVENITHSPQELMKFTSVFDQFEFRRDLVIEVLRQADTPLDFDAVIGRGGLAKPVAGGVYRVDDDMIRQMRAAKHEHACDLGCMLAQAIADITTQCPAYIADPASVDELNPYCRISGSPLMPRVSIWHALNQRAIARRYAKEKATRYEDLNLIVCHLGGGISVGAHDHGRCVDVNNALDGEGPFSPERAGTLPAADLIHLCYSGKYTEAQLLKRIAGKAGLTAHLGMNDLRQIEAAIADGDSKAELVLNAMIYHIAKNIAAQAAVFCGKIDAILLTGGMAHSNYVISQLTKRIEFLAPIHVYPGENEMLALAQNALAVLNGQCQAKKY